MAPASRKPASSLPKIDHLGPEDLLALIKQAEERLVAKREETRSKFLADMRRAAEKAGLNFDELVADKSSDARRKRSDVGVKLSPKFVGPNGEIYKGRGPTPKWLKALERKGVDREKFRVKGV
jgi:DNA-binding protein H-NS